VTGEEVDLLRAFVIEADGSVNPVRHLLKVHFIVGCSIPNVFPISFSDELPAIQ
jgi:hypothetical protein